MENVDLSSLTPKSTCPSFLNENNCSQGHQNIRHYKPVCILSYRNLVSNSSFVVYCVIHVRTFHGPNVIFILCKTDVFTLLTKRPFLNKYCLSHSSIMFSLYIILNICFCKKLFIIVFSSFSSWQLFTKRYWLYIKKTIVCFTVFQHVLMFQTISRVHRLTQWL